MTIRRFTLMWWPVVAGAVVGLAASLSISALSPPSYVATATLFLGSPASTDSSGAYTGDLFSQQRASTYAQLVGSRDLAVKVIDDLGLSTKPDELVQKVTSTQVPRTVLLEVSATDSSPQRAADLANAYAENLKTYVARLETPVGSNEPSSTVTITQKAEAPSAAQWPNVWMVTVGAVALGVFLGLLAIWLRGKLFRTVRDAEELAGVTGVPVLGVLPRDRARLVRPMSPTTDAGSDYSEAVRTLRTNVLYTGIDTPPTTIAFLAPVSTMSTTATLTNLAIALDAAGKRSVVVDADLRGSRLSDYLGDNSDKGLAEVLSGDVAVEDATLQIADSGVRVIFAGTPKTAPSDLLASESMTTAVESLKESSDYVFFDTPGVLSATDAAVVGLVCDAVVLIAIAGRTRLAPLKQTRDSLHRLGINIVGAVLAEAR